VWSPTAPAASAPRVCVGCVHTFLKSTHDGGILTYELTERFDQTIASVIGRLRYIFNRFSKLRYSGRRQNASEFYIHQRFPLSLAVGSADWRTDSGYWFRSHHRRRTQDAV